MRRRLLHCMSLVVALNNGPPFSGRPSLTGYCGRGWTCNLPRPVAIDVMDGARSRQRSAIG